MSGTKAMRVLLLVGMVAVALALSQVVLAGGSARGDGGVGSTSSAAASTVSCAVVCVDANCRSFSFPSTGIEITKGLILYPTRACLCRNGDGTYRVEGEGEFFLPNIQTTQGISGIHATFVLAFPSLDPQCVAFSGSWPAGVPIGESGFLLTSLQGEADLTEPTLCATATIESELQLPDGTGPAVTGEGQLCIEFTEPYTATFQGALNVIGVRTIEAAATLDQVWGLAASVLYSGPYFSGPANLHIWKEGDSAYGFNGSATLTYTAAAGAFNPAGWPAWLPSLPSQPVSLTAEVELGEFCLGCQGTACISKTYGLWAGAAVETTLPRNVVEPGSITARFLLSSTGILSATTNLMRCSQTTRAVGAADMHEVTVTVQPTELSMFVVEWQQGHPEVTLVDPQGSEITPASVVGRDNMAYLTALRGAAYLVRNPQTGAWRVEVSSIRDSVSFTLTTFCLNRPPTLTLTSVEPGGDGAYVVRWTAGDPDDAAPLALYYDRDASGRDGRLVAYCVRKEAGSYIWNTGQVGSGGYYIYGRIDDGKNLPVISYGAQRTVVTDTTAPAQPGAPSFKLEGGAVALTWPPNGEEDVAGYQVYYGAQSGVYAGSYDATNLTYFRLPQAPSPQTRYLAVRAYDSSGNAGAFSEEARMGIICMPLITD